MFLVDQTISTDKMNQYAEIIKNIIKKATI